MYVCLYVAVTNLHGLLEDILFFFGVRQCFDSKSATQCLRNNRIAKLL